MRNGKSAALILNKAKWGMHWRHYGRVIKDGAHIPSDRARLIVCMTEVGMPSIKTCSDSETAPPGVPICRMCGDFLMRSGRDSKPTNIEVYEQVGEAA